jgi:hypothetical protein
MWHGQNYFTLPLPKMNFLHLFRFVFPLISVLSGADAPIDVDVIASHVLDDKKLLPRYLIQLHQQE